LPLRPALRAEAAINQVVTGIAAEYVFSGEPVDLVVGERAVQLVGKVVSHDACHVRLLRTPPGLAGPTTRTLVSTR
jgi:hypothetical protein